MAVENREEVRNRSLFVTNLFILVFLYALSSCDDGL